MAGATVKTTWVTGESVDANAYNGLSLGALGLRTGTTAGPGATPALNTDQYDLYTYTALAAAITSMTAGLTGTAFLGQKLLVGFKDNGTARAITWGASFTSTGVATLLATTVPNKQHWVGLLYDGSKWACLAVDTAGY